MSKSSPLGVTLIFVHCLVFSSVLYEATCQEGTVSRPRSASEDCGLFETKHRAQDLKYLGKAGVISFPGNEDIITVPYLALLGSESEDPPFDSIKSVRCVGSIISDRWILTAAQCVTNANISFVRLAEHDLDTVEDLPNEHPIDVGIAEVIVHPLFSSWSYDLALIRLDTQIPSYRYDIGAVCLPWGEEAQRDHVAPFVKYLLQEGWGRDQTGSSSTLYLVDPAQCAADYGTLWPGGFVGQDVVCAKVKEENSAQMKMDACTHLSGSALTYLDPAGRRTIAALVTIGIEGKCVSENFPSIYMPIYAEINLLWIKDVVFGEGPGIPVA